MTYRLVSYEAEGGPRGGLMIDGKVYDLERETRIASVLQAIRAGKGFPAKARSEPLKNPRLTLQPGDLIMTGTPAGVGMPRKRFLRPGEPVRLWIEKIGELEHRMS